jgi:hypothetical protein
MWVCVRVHARTRAHEDACVYMHVLLPNNHQPSNQPALHVMSSLNSVHEMNAYSADPVCLPVCLSLYLPACLSV